MLARRLVLHRSAREDLFIARPLNAGGSAMQTEPLVSVEVAPLPTWMPMIIIGLVQNAGCPHRAGNGRRINRRRSNSHQYRLQQPQRLGLVDGQTRRTVQCTGYVSCANHDRVRDLSAAGISGLVAQALRCWRTFLPADCLGTPAFLSPFLSRSTATRSCGSPDPPRHRWLRQPAPVWRSDI